MRHSSSYESSEANRFMKEMAQGRLLNSGFTGSIARGFQQDFSDFISSALGREKSFSATLPGLNVFILRGDLEIIGHDMGECAILQNTETAAHVLLVGERIKRNLNFRQGIQAFETNEGRVVAEIDELFSLWQKDMEPFKIKHAGNRYDLMDEIRILFTETDFEPLYETFVPRVPRLPATRPLRRQPPNGFIPA